MTGSREGSLIVLHSPLLSELAWLVHGFGTRTAGLDQSKMASLKQIHSDVVLRASCPGQIGSGDALITEERGLIISVRTADCYPILVADVRKRTVAVIHAGWRGTAARIVENTLTQMQSDPRDIIAAIGPGIGSCCYVVGEEVAKLFPEEVPLLGHPASNRSMNGELTIDLAAANRNQLLQCGVPAAQIDMIRECTFCHADRYYSFRREKEHAGRMISFMRIRGAQGH